MDYLEALNYINDKNKFGSRLGLDVISKLLDLLGNPHLGMKYIHIGGTNGKGSVSAYIKTALEEAGYRVGLFTSPYLERFNERISINGEDIPNEELARITERIKQKIEIMLKEGYEHPTTFEIVTTIAFVYFSEQNLDYVVLEVGLGGRADSTNVIKKPIASVITNIDYDHVDILGNTLGKIAYEKAGIIKEEGLVISYTQQQEALEVLKKVSEEQNAQFIQCPMNDIIIKSIDEFGSIFDFRYNNKIYKDIKISMLGKYQICNAILALCTLLTLRDKNLLNITDNEIRIGLQKTKWNGRLEILKRNPIFLIDGAHNPQGVKSLVDNLNIFKYNKLILGTGILKDKDVEHMVEILAPKADNIIITQVNMPRKMEAEDLEEIINRYNKNTSIEKDIKKAIDKSYELATEEDLIIFVGSLYLIGDVRKIVLQIN